jgi:CRISPR-associated protein Csd2
MSAPLTNRHDLLILFEVTNGNPNGDPDSGNMPRVDPSTSLGLVSDVCLKRKIRNFVQLFPPSANGKGYDILIQQGAVIERSQQAGIKATDKPDNAADKRSHAERVKDWICRHFYDVRAFGQVISTGDSVMKGSTYGQIRGPVQFTFGRSFHPVLPVEITITRCAVTKEADAAKERTMGQKHIVPYALYAAKCYLSPPFAEQTGFDQKDYEILIEAMTHMFDHDRSAARGDMVVRGLFDFEHVGTQSDVNADQNKREARLGCAHAHQLFETIKVELREGVAQPASFANYSVTFDFDAKEFKNKFKGVKPHIHVNPNP